MATAIILAAGKGSRLGSITEDRNKCTVDLGGTTSLAHNIELLWEYEDVENFIVVVGYKVDSVCREIERILKNNQHINIEVAFNPHYEDYGCEFSVAVGADRFDHLKNPSSALYITEADSIIRPGSWSMRSCQSEDYVLLRDIDTINPKRSVVAVGVNDFYSDRIRKVDYFAYDPDHENVIDYLRKSDEVIGESLQLWKFVRNKADLTYKLDQYYRAGMRYVTGSADPSSLSFERTKDASGLMTINNVLWSKGPMKGVMVGDDVEWINLNTMEDYKRALNADWILGK